MRIFGDSEQLVLANRLEAGDVLAQSIGMSPISLIPAQVLERICEVLADTQSGITGSDIGKYLSDLGIPDPLPKQQVGRITVGMTKRIRLYEALRAQQEKDGRPTQCYAFIEHAMSPVRHTDSAQWFETKRGELNTVLAFVGVTLHQDGKLRASTVAKTLDEAEQRAQSLKRELIRRGVHPDVLKFCNAELLQENYFHAVLEATKSVSAKIRERTGLTSDGGELAYAAFTLGKTKTEMPYLAFNTLRDDTEKSEHVGLLNLFTGMFGTFRNTTAHGAKIHWKVDEKDALDLLTLASFLHRRLDAAARTPKQ